MMKIGKTALRPKIALVRQVSLSIAATLVATAIVAGLREEVPFLQQRAVSAPLLTSGGKFAARVELLAAADKEEPVALVAVLPPLLAVEAMQPIGQRPASPAMAATPPSSASAHVLKRLLPAEPRRRAVADAVLPPRRADFIAAEPVDAPARTAVSGIAGLWSASKALVGQAASVGVSVWDSVSPTRLLSDCGRVLNGIKGLQKLHPGTPALGLVRLSASAHIST